MEVIENIIHVDLPVNKPAIITVIIKLKDSIDDHLEEIELSDTLLVHSNDYSEIIDNVTWLSENHPLCLLRNCESPIELKFYIYALKRIPGLKPQVNIGKYRVDFAIPEKRIVIELDGHPYHSSRNQRTRDAKRERDLILQDWTVIRFTGSEIHENVFRCIDEAKQIVEHSQ